MESLTNIYLVVLCYEIEFRDADVGWCYAGDGQKNIRGFYSKQDADTLILKWNPIIANAEKETTVFPVQPNNAAIKQEFGFTLDNFDDARAFKLIVEEIKIN